MNYVLAVRHSSEQFSRNRLCDFNATYFSKSPNQPQRARGKCRARASCDGVPRVTQQTDGLFECLAGRPSQVRGAEPALVDEQHALSCEET